MGRKSDLLKEEVLRLYAEGQSVIEILELVNMSYNNVLLLLKQKGVYKPQPVKKHDVTKERILELLEQQKSIVDVASETKMPLTVVTSSLKKTSKGRKEYSYAGNTFDTYAQWRNFKLSIGTEIRKLEEEGMTRKAIAEKFNISILSVARFLD